MWMVASLPTSASNPNKKGVTHHPYSNKKGGSNESPLFLKIFYKVLLYSLSEFSTSLELSNLLSSDSDLLLGSRVDTLTSRLLLYCECTEANELNLITSLQSTLNSFYCGIESLL